MTMTPLVNTTSCTSPPPSPWAFDSDHNELDPKLKAAQRVALLDDPRWSEMEHTEPLVLRNLLSDEQIDEILTEASVDGVWPRGVVCTAAADENNIDSSASQHNRSPPCHRNRPDDDENNNDKEAEQQPESSSSHDGSSAACEELREVPHQFAWTDGHVVLYMHNNDHWFVRALPTPWSIIRGGMESQPWMDGAIPVLADEFIGSDQSMMQVRTIELHHYATGGGLLTPGHRDTGSDLTISVLLSDPAEVSGGDFVTYDPDGVPVAHKMGRGDAILFKSEKLHNISTVTSGVRKSLVVELWPSKRY